MKKLIPKALAVKTFGMPRYVWLLGFILIVGVYAYIRYRNSQEEIQGDDSTAQTEPEVEVDPGLGVKGYLGADYGAYGYQDTGLRTMPAAGIVSGPPIVTEGAPPIQLEPTTIIINAQTDKKGSAMRKCSDGRPTAPPPKGYHWACVAGFWVPRANKQKASSDKPKPKPTPDNKRCGKRPKKSARKGFEWKCKGGHWREVRIQPKKKVGVFFDGPLMPSGMGPFRRDNHRIDRSPGNRDKVRLR